MEQSSAVIRALVIGCSLSLMASGVGAGVARAGTLTASGVQFWPQIELAYEYAWHEDYEEERALLEAAANGPAGAESARATVLLAEARGYAGDKEAAQALLERVRTQYQDPEIHAFADLIQALIGRETRFLVHGRRLYGGKQACQQLYAEASERWRGTWPCPQERVQVECHRIGPGPDR